MQAIAPLVMALAVLFPAKLWYAPTQPIEVTVKAEGEHVLMLTDFTGKLLDPGGTAPAAGGQTVDLRKLFPAIGTPGTYTLFAVPKGKELAQFVGTPLVIEVRQDSRARGAQGPLVVRVAPLRYAVMTTDQGAMTMVFYHDAAPNTADNFLRLASEGYYDGLTLHRIVPGFVLQGGDPRGDGMGGPGYQIVAEFNDRKHEEGVLSMARQGDPDEAHGARPRPEFANSAGSQFFICLDYSRTKALDGKYTAFGRVVEGMDVARKLEKTPLADQASGRPQDPPVIRKVQVLPVTAEKNPYAAIMPRLKQPQP